MIKLIRLVNDHTVPFKLDNFQSITKLAWHKSSSSWNCVSQAILRSKVKVILRSKVKVILRSKVKVILRSKVKVILRSMVKVILRSKVKVLLRSKVMGTLTGQTICLKCCVWMVPLKCMNKFNLTDPIHWRITTLKPSEVCFLSICFYRWVCRIVWFSLKQLTYKMYSFFSYKLYSFFSGWWLHTLVIYLYQKTTPFENYRCWLVTTRWNKLPTS